MNAHATQELVGREALMRSLSSLAPALWQFELAERVTCDFGSLVEKRLPVLCFDGVPLFRFKITVRAARGAGIEGFRVEPADGLEKLVGAILTNDRESRFPVVWHDGWPFVAGCDSATIAGGAGASNSRPDGDGGAA
ncbi:hypothetical protein [Pedomonas sp. V897]|uniref:hypothetical protein n=1 Tax=Pedomonas sp. V897 TaxID=3446482 RepID=UPI003EE00ED9